MKITKLHPQQNKLLMNNNFIDNVISGEITKLFCYKTIIKH